MKPYRPYKKKPSAAQRERRRFARMVAQYIPWRLVNLSGGHMSHSDLDAACQRVLERFRAKLDDAGSVGISRGIAAQMLDTFCQEQVRAGAEAAREALVDAVQTTVATLQATLEHMKTVEDMRRVAYEAKGPLKPEAN
jgi:hypothetical protein